jgi:paraquat-inducible protein B
MNEPEQETKMPDRVAEPVVRRRRRLPTVWLIPLVATVIGVWLAFNAFVTQGPSIVITFPNADGLEAGRTKIKCKEVEIGKVKSIRLSRDQSKVEVTAELTRDASDLLSEHSRFWIVRARVSTSGVSGLGTLLSGAYISMDPGEPGKSSRRFEGLENPPTVISHQDGQLFTLRAEKLGSMSIGSPVYFRQIPVGEVAGYDLEPDGKSVSIKVFVRAPYDKLVHKDTRFWNVGGVDVTLDSNGIRMSSDSMIDLLLGGVAFENPVSLESSEPAPKNQVFALYASHDRIYEKVYLDRRYYVVDFNESVRGLTRGASVEFRGIKIGQVEDLKLELQTQKLEVHVPVLIAIEPERLTLLGGGTASMDKVVEQLIARGLRAQLKMGSLLTSSLFVDLDFYPQAPPRTLGQYGKYREIPTTPSTMGALLSNLTSFLDKLQKLPLEDIANELKTSIPALREALQEATELIKHLDKETAPKAEATLAQAQSALAAMEKVLKSDSPLQRDLQRTLDEFTKASRALRDLADSLQRNPETLIWGKGKEQEP